MNREKIYQAALAAAALAWLAGPLLVFQRSGPDLRAFGDLPVVHMGRLKPLDTAARSSLLVISGRQTASADGRSISAAEWLLDVVAKPETADRYPIFTIDHPELLALLDLPAGAGRRFSYLDVQRNARALAEQTQIAQSADASRRSSFQQAVVNLAERLDLYMQLKVTIWPPDRGLMTDGLKRLSSADARSSEMLRFMASAAAFRPILAGDCSESGFMDVGSAALASASGRPAPNGLTALARLRDAAAANDVPAFNVALAAYQGEIEGACPRQAGWMRHEALFNRIEPFYRGLGLYLASLLFLLAGWLINRPKLERAGVGLAAAAFAVHTAGLVFRTVIQGRPPVTNLYSSAVFVGWVAAGAGLLFARIYRRSLAVIAADAIGFSTLIIAHHLAAQGDTIEMMRAVLDSNFWLTTHVVTITMGYGAGLLAAALAHVALFRMAVRRRRGAEPVDGPLIDMIYALLCACLVLSFVGTVLGGIWADRSWGRFWGWDPKENGALVIVLWNALALHARWGGAIRQRGLAVMALIGGVVTALAWFGVNMLGVGLHSYGFTDAAFYGLSAFILAEALILGGCWLSISRPLQSSPR